MFPCLIKAFTFVPLYIRMTETPRVEGRIALDKPRWLQDTYMGRAKHFFSVTDPRNVLASGPQLESARKLLQLYRLSIS